MAFLSARDRYIELVFLAVWASLLVWGLVERLGSGAPLPWESGSLLLLTSMLLGSVSQFVRANRVRWSLLGVSLVLMIVALFLIVP
jgi:hypothetical protein